MTINYKVLSGDAALFLRLLNRYANPFEQIQLRVHLIQQRAKRGIPGSHFSVDSTSEETQSMVTVPWIPQAFTIDEKAHEQVRLKFLREGVIDVRQEGVALHPVIDEALRATNSSKAILAGGRAVLTKVKSGRGILLRFSHLITVNLEPKRTLCIVPDCALRWTVRHGS